MVTIEGLGYATNCRSGEMPRGMMGRGLEGQSFPPRKPLIKKTNDLAHRRASAHRIAQHQVGVSAWRKEVGMKRIFRRLWSEDEAQDIAEYAVMLAVILVIVVGTIRLIGANANNVFSSVASSISQ
jgi:Flp pilus assembly pilin Flp